MTVRSDRSTVLIGLLCLLPFAFLAYLFYQISEIAVSIVLIVVPMILYARFLVAVCRIFQFSNAGITIRLFRFQKHYNWNDVTLHQESYENRKTISKPQYKNCIFFNTARFHKPRFIQPLLYCVLFHPYGFVFLQYDLRYDAPEVFPVNGECFMKQYAEWQTGSQTKHSTNDDSERQENREIVEFDNTEAASEKD